MTIRGAITVKSNTEVEIITAATTLLMSIIKQNNIHIYNITQIIFTATKDLTKAYPAVAARNMGITKASLLCVQEMYVENSLPLCIRVLLSCNEQCETIKHVYLGEAINLRPDWAIGG